MLEVISVGFSLCVYAHFWVAFHYTLNLQFILVPNHSTFQVSTRYNAQVFSSFSLWFFVSFTLITAQSIISPKEITQNKYDNAICQCIN